MNIKAVFDDKITHSLLYDYDLWLFTHLLSSTYYQAVTPSPPTTLLLKKSLESPVWGYTAPSCHSWGCAGHTGLPGALGYLWRASWISSPGSGRAPADTESWKKSKNNNSSHVRGARMATSGCVRVTRWVNCPVVILTFVDTKKKKQ